MAPPPKRLPRILNLVPVLDWFSFCLVILLWSILVFSMNVQVFYLPAAVHNPTLLLFFSHGLRLNAWLNENPTFLGLMSVVCAIIGLAQAVFQFQLWATFSQTDLLEGDAPGYRNITSNPNPNYTMLNLQVAILSLEFCVGLLMSLFIVLYVAYFVVWIEGDVGSSLSVRGPVLQRRKMYNANHGLNAGVMLQETFWPDRWDWFTFDTAAFARNQSLSACAFGIFLVIDVAASLTGIQYRTGMWLPSLNDVDLLLAGTVGLNVRVFGAVNRDNVVSFMGNQRGVYTWSAWVSLWAWIVAIACLFWSNAELDQATQYSNLGIGCYISQSCYVSLAGKTSIKDNDAIYVPGAAAPSVDEWGYLSYLSAVGRLGMLVFGSFVCMYQAIVFGMLTYGFDERIIPVVRPSSGVPLPTPAPMGRGKIAPAMVPYQDLYPDKPPSAIPP